ncbi:MAG: hypothetical protein VX026_08170 [Myxococcota bacterium]|nr:hypothetical protein [Myxococcota bacterium]
MSADQILSAFGAKFEANILLHYGNAKDELEAITHAAGLYCHATHPFTLEGEDVQRWCNGMLSNNIRKLQPLQGNRNAVCTAKGSLEGLLYVYCLSVDKFLCLPDGIDADWFGQRFRQFLFLDDIELEPLDKHFTLSIIGPKALTVAEAIGFGKPDEDKQVVAKSDDQWAVFGTRYGLDCVDIVCSINEFEAVIQSAIKSGAQLTGEQAITHRRIQFGAASWPNDKYSEKPLIHALRLNHDCCAFDKGCYVGQEIINRIDVKGILGRQLQVMKLSGTVPTGTSLVDPDTNKVLGPLTSISTLGEPIGLAVLPKAYWEKDTVLSLGETGETATVLMHPSANPILATPAD